MVCYFRRRLYVRTCSIIKSVCISDRYLYSPTNHPTKDPSSCTVYSSIYIVLWLFYPQNCSKFSPISCPKCRHNHEKGCAHHAIHHPRKRRIQFIHCDYIGTEAQRTKLPNIPESIFRYHPTAMLNSQFSACHVHNGSTPP